MNTLPQKQGHKGLVVTPHVGVTATEIVIFTVGAPYNKAIRISKQLLTTQIQLKRSYGGTVEKLVDSVAPEHQPRLEKALDQIAAMAEPLELELRTDVADNTVRSLGEICVQPDLLNNGHIVHVRDAALVLPSTASLEQRALSLDLFIGGLLPICRREAHAYALQAGEFAVIGDEKLAGLEYGDHMESQDPYVVQMTREGSLTHLFMSSPGALHPAQTLVTRTHHLPLSGRVIRRAVCRVATPDLRYVRSLARLTAGAVEQERDLAETKAVSEAVERFAMGSASRAHLVAASQRSLGSNCIEPMRFSGYSQQQMRRDSAKREFDPYGLYYWINAQTWHDTEVKLLADLVFHPFIPSDARRWSACSSSGVACHTDSSTARITAYREIVERDAFMRAWLSGNGGRLVLDESLPSLGLDIKEELSAEGNILWPVLLPCQEQHVVLAVVGNKDRLLAGLGAASTLGKACDRTILEAWATWSAPVVTLSDPHDVRSADDHHRYYAAQPIQTLQWMHSLHRPVACEDRVAHVVRDDLAHAHKSEGLYYVPLPCPDTEREVWRCLSTKHIPMTFGFDNEPLGLGRASKLLGPRSPRLGLGEVLRPHPLG